MNTGVWSNKRRRVFQNKNQVNLWLYCIIKKHQRIDGDNTKQLKYLSSSRETFAGNGYKKTEFPNRNLF